MEFTNFAIFIAASWILIITPGPDIFYVMTRGISQGKKAGILSATGVTLGLLVHTLFAAMGLAIILRTSALAFMCVKFAGAAYLIYLGIQSIRNPVDKISGPNNKMVKSRTIFFQGILTNLLNPKVALFFLAFLPQFADHTQGNMTLQMVCLGGTYAFFGLIFLVLLGYFSGRIGLWLSTRENLTKTINRLTGSILVVLGLRLVLSDNS